MSCPIRAVVFDMDDTLYDEMMFVRSGFQSVARYLGIRFDLEEQKIYQIMLELLNSDGRGKIFDSVLKLHNIYSPRLVEELIEVYRTHTPKISLYSDVVETLERLRVEQLKIGIITDGLHSVQKTKVRALKLQDLVDFIIYTDELGSGYEKPHPAAFLRAIEILNCKPTNILYVGNNPEKDIFGANSVGMGSAHICRGDYTCNGSCNARFHAKSLKSLFDDVPLTLGEG